MKSKMRKMVFVPLALVLALGATMSASAADVSINGERVQLGAEPVVQDGRTLLPVRFVTEAMGANVEWNGETRAVTISKGDASLVLTIDSNAMAVTRGGSTETVNLEVAAQIIGDRTFVPIYAIVEALGATVSSADSAINIAVAGNVVTPPAQPAPPVETPPATGGGFDMSVVDFYADLLEMQMHVSMDLSASTDFATLMPRLEALEEITALIMATDYMSIESMRVKANGLAAIAARFGINVDAFAHLL